MAHFTRIPNEVLLEIINLRLADDGPPRSRHNRCGPRLAESPRDLFSLMLVCRKLYILFQPILYRFNRDHEGSYAVTWAAEHGLTGTLDTALSYGLNTHEAAIHATSFQARIPARARTRPGVKSPPRFYTISKPGLIDEQPTDSPLHRAVAAGQDAAVAWFLDQGADVDGDRRFPFRCSRDCSVGRFEGGKYCASTLHIALCCRKASTALLLISRGVPLEYRRVRRYPCSQAANRKIHALLEAAYYGLEDVVEDLVKGRNSLNIAEIHNCGLNALAFAAMGPGDNLSMVQKILHLDTTLLHGSGTTWKQTPLHFAIQQNNFSAASYLLDAGATIDPFHPMFSSSDEVYSLPTPISDSFERSTDKKGQRLRRRAFLRRLLEGGANPNEYFEHQYYGSALDVVIGHGEAEDVDILLQAGATLTPYHVEAVGLDLFSRGVADDKLLLLMRHGARIEDVLVKLLNPSGYSMDWKDADLARRMDELLGHATSRNFSDEFLSKMADEYLDARRYELFLVFASHAPWHPSAGRLYYHIRRMLENVELSQRDMVMASLGETDDRSAANMSFRHLQHTWQQALSCLLAHCSDERDCLLLLHVAIRSDSSHGANLLLDRLATIRLRSCDLLPSLLMLAVQKGQVSIIKRIWRSLVIVQQHPDFIDSCLRQAVLCGHYGAALFFIQHGADPFCRMEPLQWARLNKNLHLVYNAASAGWNTGVETHRSLFSENSIFADDGYLSHRKSDYGRHMHLFVRPHLLYEDAIRRTSSLELAVLCGREEVLHALLGVQKLPETVRSHVYHVPCMLSKAEEVEKALLRYGLSVTSEG